MKSLKNTLLVAGCLGLLHTASAVMLVVEDFENYNTGGLATQAAAASGTVGLTGNWTTANAAVQIYATGSLSYAIPGGATLGDGGTKVQALSGSGSRRYGAPLGSAIPGGTTSIYFGALIAADAAWTTPWSIFWYPFATGATSADFNNYFKVSADANGEVVIGEGVNKTVLTDTLFGNTTGTHLVVARLDFNGAGGTADQFSVWLDPTPGSEGTPNGFINMATASANATTKTTTDMTFFTLHNERIKMDHVVYATTWADVVPVPEPAAAATLLALAVGGWMAIRRRRA